MGGGGEVEKREQTEGGPQERVRERCQERKEGMVRGYGAKS